jgi:DNA-directed RNA polymerase subunit RPC12/RpoP
VIQWTYSASKPSVLARAGAQMLTLHVAPAAEKLIREVKTLSRRQPCSGCAQLAQPQQPRTSTCPCSSRIDVTSAAPRDATARSMRPFSASASQGPYLQQQQRQQHKNEQHADDGKNYMQRAAPTACSTCSSRATQDALLHDRHHCEVLHTSSLLVPDTWV